MSISKQEYLKGLGKFKEKWEVLNEGKFLQAADVVGAVKYKGSVANYSALPATGNVIGDMYNVKAAGGVDADGIAIKAGDNVIWNGDGWDNYGGTIDISGKVDKEIGKGLSTNDFTDELKQKLEDINPNVNENVIETVKVDGVALVPDGEKAVNVDMSGKVDKVTGKQLSTEDYTSSEKTKLADIESGAQVNVIEKVSVDGTELGITNKTVALDLSGKVDKVTGKQLSTNDFTEAYKTKLDGIATGAQVNVIEAVKVDGVALAIADKAVNLDLSSKVDVVAGKGLSTNDFTDAYKTKLDGIVEETITQADIDELFA